MTITDDDDPPSFAINDTSAGLLLAYGIVLALLNRERTGEGQWVHTSLLEAQIFMLDFQAARYLMKGEVAGQEGNYHPTSPGTGFRPDRGARDERSTPKRPRRRGYRCETRIVGR